MGQKWSQARSFRPLQVSLLFFQDHFCTLAEFLVCHTSTPDTCLHPLDPACCLFIPSVVYVCWWLTSPLPPLVSTSSTPLIFTLPSLPDVFCLPSLQCIPLLLHSPTPFLKLLTDANISPRLANILFVHFPAVLSSLCWDTGNITQAAMSQLAGAVSTSSHLVLCRCVPLLMINVLKQKYVRVTWFPAGWTDLRPLELRLST